MSDNVIPDEMVGHLTDPGLQRRENQDKHWVSRPPDVDPGLLAAKGALFAVADGMGGEAGGRLASERTIEVLVESYYGDPSTDVMQCLDRAIDAANREVTAEARATPYLHGMGSTLTAAVIHDRQLFVAHVGDSRAYLLRPGAATRQLTTDHTWVQEQVAQGVLTPEDAARHPNRSMITRAIGGAPEVVPDPWSELLQPGDRLLLCSDGLTNVVTDDELAQAVDAYPPQEAARHLVDLANQRGGPDNITVVIVAMPGQPDPAFHAQETMPTDARGYPIQRESGGAPAAMVVPPDTPPDPPPAPQRTPPRLAPYLLAVAGLVSLALVALIVVLIKGVDEPLAEARAELDQKRRELASAPPEEVPRLESTVTALAATVQAHEAAATAEAAAGTATARARSTAVTPAAAGAGTTAPPAQGRPAGDAIVLKKPTKGEVVGCVNFEWGVPARFESLKEIVYEVRVCDSSTQGAACTPEAIVKNPQAFKEVWDPGKTEELVNLGHRFSGMPGMYRWRVVAKESPSLPADSAVESFEWNGEPCGKPTPVEDDPPPQATKGDDGG